MGIYYLTVPWAKQFVAGGLDKVRNGKEKTKIDVHHTRTMSITTNDNTGELCKGGLTTLVKGFSTRSLRHKDSCS